MRRFETKTLRFLGPCNVARRWAPKGHAAARGPQGCRKLLRPVATRCRVLQCGGRRIIFTDAERRTLGSLAKTLGRKALRELDPIVTPATLLRWHRELVARKWTSPIRHRPGRPRTRAEIEQLVVRMATENTGWGYTRTLGALTNLGVSLGRGTIQRILKEHLIEPAPIRRKTISWSTFLKAHWRGLAASDFFTVEVWSLKGLLTFYVLFVIDLPTRRVTICGMTTHPDESWMLQMSRNLLDPEFGFLRDKNHLIVDRDTKYSAAFRLALEREGIGVIRLPPRSPNMNACAERFVRSVKEEASPSSFRSSRSSFLNVPAELSIRGADSADS
jgi:putative transposase